MATEIRSLTDTSTGVIADTFIAAFADYAISFDRTEFLSMLRRRGYTANCSYGVFDGPRMIAFALSGCGTFNSQKTIYDIATATLPEFRGSGLAGRLLTHVIGSMKLQGFEQYLLEVLSDNTSAIKLYKGQGFVISRHFACHRQTIEKIRCRNICLPGLNISEVSAIEAAKNTNFRDFYPSWQNSAASVERAADYLIAFEARLDNSTAGYIIGDPISGDITQLAVTNQWRRHGIGTALLQRFIKNIHCTAIKVLNIDTSCTSLINFLNGINIPEATCQFEMTRSLN